MSRVACVIAGLAVALWLGGMIFLFVAVQTLFANFPKAMSDVAVEGAPRLFASFERYQLIVGAAALVASFAWYLSTRSKIVMTLFVLLALSAAGAAVSTMVITSKMQQLRAAGQSGSPAFMKLHGQSMMVYTSQAALLLASAVIVPVAAARTAAAAAAGRSPRTAPGSAAA